MIRKFAKILPYCIVMWLIKKFSPDIMNGTNFMNDKLVGWRIDKGEWIIWNEDNYNRMNENEKKNKEKKLDKKFSKFIRKVSSDYDLNEELKEHYKEEIRREEEDKM